MPSGGDGKFAYVARVRALFQQYNRILIVSADNVGSKQFQAIRASLRPHSVVLMGKNTLIRRAMRELIAEGRSELEPLLDCVRRNIGIVFTSESLSKIKEQVESNRVPAEAKQGSLAPVDVIVPAGGTSLEPTKTSFLQAVGISSKIVRGNIEITTETKLVTCGTRVTASQAALLSLLGVRPFSYGLVSTTAYENGAVFDPAVLDLSDDDLLNKFRAAAANVAAVSLSLGFPTVASVPHSFINAYKNVVAVALATDYSFDAVAPLKELLADPSKLAALTAAASSAGAAAASGASGAAAAETKKEDEEEDAADFSGGGLFGGDDDGDEW